MDWGPAVRSALPEITGHAAHDEDIVEELAEHLRLRCDELQRAGASDAEARTIVLGELRDAPRLRRTLAASTAAPPAAPLPPPNGGRYLLQDTARDVRYAARLLRRSPGFTAAAVLTFALGIGMTAAIFSVVQAVVLRPVPFVDPDRLVLLWETDRRGGTSREPASVPDFVDFTARTRQIERLGGLSPAAVTIDFPHRDPVRLPALFVTAGLMPVLGVEPMIGRAFTADDERIGGAPVALISQRLWQQLFDGRPSAIGATVRLDGRPRTVIGVMPASADFGMLQVLSVSAIGGGPPDRERSHIDVWLPLQPEGRWLQRASHGLVLVGRLAPGSTVAAAQSELARIATDLERAYQENYARGVFVEPLPDVVFGRVRAPLALLFAAVLMVLGIACVNLTNLLLARGTSRRREIAVRTALGAESPRLLRQFAAENLLLTLTGGAAGILLASAVLRAMLALAPATVPRLDETTIDARVLALTVVVCTVIGFLVSLLPLRHTRSVSPQTILKAEDGRVGTSRRTAYVRSALVVAEVAMAVVLVTAAGLLIHSLWRIERVDLGFDTSGVVKAELVLPVDRYPIGPAAGPGFAAFNRFTSVLLERVRALPAVEHAALAAQHPLDIGFTTSFKVIGREAEAADWPELSLRSITPDYFATMHVPLTRGRLPGDEDTSTSPMVVVINRTLGERFFPAGDAIGQQIRFWGLPHTIVGIVGDERSQGATSAPPIAAYAPLSQTRLNQQALLVRASGDPAATIAAIRSIVRGIDPELALSGVEPLTETFAQSVGQPRFLTRLLVLLAVLALTLAGIGVHGVLSYAVAQRTREIGLRMALGAGEWEVLRLVGMQSLRLAGIGLAVGIVLALGVSRAMSGLLFEVAPTDGATLAGVVAVMALVAVMSTWLPVRRAVRIDPLAALAAE